MESPFSWRHSALEQHVCSLIQSARHMHCLYRTEVVLCPQEEVPHQLVQRPESPLVVYVVYHCHVVRMCQDVVPLQALSARKTAIISRQLMCQRCSGDNQELNAGLPSHRAPQARVGGVHHYYFPFGDQPQIYPQLVQIGCFPRGQGPDAAMGHNEIDQVTEGAAYVAGPVALLEAAAIRLSSL